MYRPFCFSSGQSQVIYIAYIYTQKMLDCPEVRLQTMKKARILTLDTQVVSSYLFICIYFMAQGKKEYRYKKKARHYMINDAE